MQGQVKYMRSLSHSSTELFEAFSLGKIDRGIRCSATGCKTDAIRSITASKVTAAGLKIDTERRAYLCKKHYREYKKATKKDRTLEKWRYKDSR